MRATRFSPFVATAAAAVIAASLSACSGKLINIAPQCDADSGDCTQNGDAGREGGGNGKVGDSCYTDSDCASPAQCMFPVPGASPEGEGAETPGAICGSAGTCQEPLGCGVDCAAPVQYIGCDCGGHSVSACQCPGYGKIQYSVIFGAPTTQLECPNDAPTIGVDAGPPGLDAGGGDGGDLNTTGSLTIDGFKCSLTSSTRQVQSAPDGHTWTLDMEATCPVLSLGQVSVFVTGKDDVTYPYDCTATAGLQLSVGGEGDAGFLAYSGANAGGSCLVNDGPIASFEPNKIRATGTLSNGGGKTHSVDVVEP
jgi:hypothetical protein